MKFYKSRTFKIFVGVLVVLIIGVAAAAAMHSGSSPANSVISTVFSPLQRASSFLAQKFSAFSINFKSSATLSKQVDELNKEIEDLQSQLVDYEQMKSQNALYKEFLELKESHKDYKFCEASVVGRDAANPLSAFVLNRGTTNAENLTVTTSGNSSAPIRSDRGGGTVNVTGGSNGAQVEFTADAQTLEGNILVDTM